MAEGPGKPGAFGVGQQGGWLCAGSALLPRGDADEGDELDDRTDRGGLRVAVLAMMTSLLTHRRAAPGGEGRALRSLRAGPWSLVMGVRH